MTLLRMQGAAVLLTSAFTIQGAVKPTIEVRIDRETVQHEPVVLWQRIQNSTQHSIALNLGYDRIGHWSFVLRRPDGTVQRARPTRRFGMSVGSRPEQVIVSAGATYVQAVVLNEWLNVEQIGIYKLTLESNQATATVVPTALTIVVKPADADTLRRHCDELADMLPVRRTGDPQLTRVAARTQLIWFRDPIVVPCLERAINIAQDPVFFDGLVAIGTVEARDAIVRLTQHRVDYIAAEAKNALARFRVR